MVQWMASLGTWALLAMVKLGLPVAVLFALGYSLYRRHPKAGLWQVEWVSPYWGGADSRRSRRACWQVRSCPPEVRERCPAYRQPEVPCWRAVKVASGGHIQSRCFECSLLLSW